MQAREFNSPTVLDDFNLFAMIAASAQQDPNYKFYLLPLYKKLQSHCEKTNTFEEKSSTTVILILASLMFFYIGKYVDGLCQTLPLVSSLLESFAQLKEDKFPPPQSLLEKRMADFLIVGLEKYLQLDGLNPHHILATKKGLAFFLVHYKTFDETRIKGLYILAQTVTPYEFFSECSKEHLGDLNACNDRKTFQHIKNELLAKSQENENNLYLQTFCALLKLREIRVLHYANQDPNLPKEPTLTAGESARLTHADKLKHEQNVIIYAKRKELREKAERQELAKCLLEFDVLKAFNLLKKIISEHTPAEFQLFPGLHFNALPAPMLLNSFLITYQCFVDFGKLFADNPQVMVALSNWGTVINELINLPLATECIPHSNLLAIRLFSIAITTEHSAMAKPINQSAPTAKEPVTECIELSAEDEKKYAKHGTTSPVAKVRKNKPSGAKPAAKKEVNTSENGGTKKKSENKPNQIIFGNPTIQAYILSNQLTEAKAHAERLKNRANTDIKQLNAALCLGDVHFALATTASTAEEKKVALANCAEHYSQCIRVIGKMPELTELEKIKVFLYEQNQHISPDIPAPLMQEIKAPLADISQSSANITLPTCVLDIITHLKKLGFKTYVVGGAVRDSLLKRSPKDWDLVTTAPFHVLEKEFGARGKILGNFRPTFEFTDGLIQISALSAPPEIGEPELVKTANQNVVIAFRGTSLEADAKLRDLNVNALYYDADAKCLIDPLNALPALLAKKIFFILDPKLHPIILLRCLRLATTLNWPLPAETQALLHENIRRVATFRLAKTFYFEFTKLLQTKPHQDLLQHFKKINLLQFIFKLTPADEACVLTLLKQHLASDAKSTLHTELAWAYLLHPRLKNLPNSNATTFQNALNELCREFGKDCSPAFNEIILTHYFKQQTVPSFSATILAMEADQPRKTLGRQLLSHGTFANQPLKIQLLPTLQTLFAHHFELLIEQNEAVLTLRWMARRKYNEKILLDAFQTLSQSLAAVDYKVESTVDKSRFKVIAGNPHKARALQELLIHLMVKTKANSSVQAVKSS